MKPISRPVVRQRKSGRWEAKIYAGMRDGKAQYVYVSGETQTEVEAAAYARQRERQPVRSLKQASLTVREWSVEFTKIHGRSLRRSTQQMYQAPLKHILQAIGDMKLRDVEPIDIEHMQQAMLGTGLSPSYVRLAHVLVRNMFERARKLKILTHNPCTDVDAPSVKSARRGVLGIGDIWKLLDAFKGTWWHDHIFVLMHTGMRRGELLGLRVRDVDIDNATISIAQSVAESGSDIWIEAPKTESAVRQISVPSDVLDVLRRRIDVFKQHGNEALLFPNRHGQLQRPTSLSIAINDKAKRLGFAAWTHILRHSHGSVLLKATGDLAQVSKRLGHSNPAITARVYSHAMDRVDHSLAAASAAAFKRPE